MTTCITPFARRVATTAFAAAAFQSTLDEDAAIMNRLASEQA
jgi:hypothetical protein